MRRAIYPGSFDPVTNGHLDIIERGCKLFDEIVIAILVHPEKKPLFTIEERREMLEEVLHEIERGRRAAARRFVSGAARAATRSSRRPTPSCAASAPSPTTSTSCRWP